MAEDVSKYTVSQLAGVLPSELKETEVGINILPKPSMLLFEEVTSTVLGLCPTSRSYAAVVANLIPPSLPPQHH